MNRFDINDHNHNLKFNLAHEFFWGFGVAFHTLYALVPLFLRKLGAPNYIIVSTTGIFVIMIALPTLFSASIGRNITNIKKAVLIVHCSILLVTFSMGFTFSILDPSLVFRAWQIYFIYFILYALSIGIIVPIWTEFLHQGTLRSYRGNFLGLGFAFNSVGSFLGGISLSYLLSLNIEFPRNFGIGFFILFLSLTVGTILFFPYRLKPARKNFRHKSIKQFLFEIKKIILHQKNFRKYIISRGFYCACFPGMGLYAIHCQNQFDFNINETGIFTIITVTFSAISSYAAGKIGDSYNNKYSMLLAYIGHLAAAIIAIYASSMIGVYAIFIAIGIGQGAFMPSAMNLIYDFSSGNDAKIYIALVDSLLAPFCLFYIILIGVLIHNGLFILSLKIIVFSILISIILMLFTVHIPKNDKIF